MAMTGGSLNFWSCPCSSFSNKARLQQYHTPPLLILSLQAVDVVNHRRQIYCSAVQESSTSTSVAAAETKEMKAATEDTTGATKPKAAAKAPAKALPQLMEEDVIPSLRETLEAQQDISDLDLSFNNNNLEGSFLKNGKRYSFWAFFPDGNINGPKGFSLSSYGMEVSTVEPFLVDEKKPTAKHVVFWVEKRLAAQGIIPVWQD